MNINRLSAPHSRPTKSQARRSFKKMMYTLNPKSMAPLEGKPLQKRLYTSAKLPGMRMMENDFEIARINLNALEALVDADQGKAIYLKAQTKGAKNLALRYKGGSHARWAIEYFLTAPDSSSGADNVLAACVNSTNNMCLFPAQYGGHDPATKIAPTFSGVRCLPGKPWAQEDFRNMAECRQVTIPAKSIRQPNHLLFYDRRRKPGTSSPKPFS